MPLNKQAHPSEAILRRLGAAAALWFALVLLPAQADEGMTRWSYTLPLAATTSAGVYTPEDVLVRTLWRGEPRSAGMHREEWDRRDDRGALVPEGTYVIRMLHHHLHYVWEGVVGNSSDTFDAAFEHKAYGPPSSLAIVANEAFYAVGYNEGQPGIHGFRLGAPQRDTHPLPSTDPFVAYSMIAADASRLYWANTGGFAHASFVAAFDLATRGVASFSSGSALCLNRRSADGPCFSEHPSVIDRGSEASDLPTGLAVQQAGRVLAVAHGGRGVVRLFDKASGASLGELQLALAPKATNQLAMSMRGDLWTISGNAVLRWTDLERRPRVVSYIDGLVKPIALAASTVDDGVWVADGGASSQLKRFDGQGRALTVVGVRGGYATDPAVTPDKLCFRSREGDERTGIAAAADASVWVIDTCNNRMLRFRPGAGATMHSDAAIAYLPASYASTVDHGQPGRVFANFLEFDVERQTPLVPGGAKLVRNWLAGLPPALVDDKTANFGFAGFASVETLANGRTYAMLKAGSRQAIVELPASGPARLVKVFGSALPGSSEKVLYEGGALGYALTGAQTQSVLRLPLSGFDERGDPVWASEPVVLATVPFRAGSPNERGSFSGALPPRFPLTGSGRVVFFDSSVKGNEGFHLGAAAQHGNSWLWQASPTGRLDGKGSFQTAAIDGSLQYGGNVVWANGRHIVYGYHGEFYKDLGNGRIGQANQFMHFDESGLFLGQFGQPSTQPALPQSAGTSGNSFAMTLVRAADHLYVYHNDEWAHGGVHRWRIDGTDSIGELRGTGQLGDAIELR